MRVVEITDTETPNKVLNFIANSKEEDCMPITMISCRLDNLAIPLLEKNGMSHNTHVFVNNDLIEDFKKKYPTTNFYAREEFIKPGDFADIAKCPGGARMLSFRGAKELGFNRIISCDDDLTTVNIGVPLDNKEYSCTRATTDFYKDNGLLPNRQGIIAGSIAANWAFDHVEDAIVGEPAYSGMLFSNKPMTIKYPGNVFCHSDYFYIDLDRFQPVMDSMNFDSNVDIDMLKTQEDQFYAMLIFALGKTQFKMPFCIREKSTKVVTANEGRTDSTLSELLPELKKDPRFGHIVSNEKLKISGTKGKTLNKDYAYFTTHNSSKFYEDAVGKKAISWDFRDMLPEPTKEYDVLDCLSTENFRVVTK